MAGTSVPDPAGRVRSRSPQDPGEPVDHHQVDDEEFWLRHLRLGLVLFVVAIAWSVVYVVAGDAVRPSAVLLLAGLAALSVAVVALLPHRAIVQSPRRDAFFYGWSVFAVAYVILVTAVDGGAGSPMALLLVLPVIYAGLAYPAAAVVGIAGASCAAYAVLSVTGPPAETGEVVMLTGAIFCTGVAAASVARSRARTHERLLVLHRQLAEAARRDSLTGCLTRAAFHDAVAAELARAERQAAAASVLMIDLDGFKTVNDTAGHLAGDAALASVGRILLASLRTGDDAGRVGGDEFAVVLAGTGDLDAARTAERLLCELAAGGVSASIGVATAVAGEGTEALLARADAALYEAKRAGKGRVTGR